MDPINVPGKFEVHTFYGLQIWPYIHRVHPNKSPLKFWRKGSVGISRDCPEF